MVLSRLMWKLEKKPPWTTEYKSKERTTGYLMGAVCEALTAGCSFCSHITLPLILCLDEAGFTTRGWLACQGKDRSR